MSQQGGGINSVTAPPSLHDTPLRYAKKMTEELLLPTTLGGTGVGLLVLGLILTYYLKIYGGMMAYRDVYADNLEKEGEIERAEKVRIETKHIVKRVPIYGKTMLIIGGILILAALFTL